MNSFIFRLFPLLIMTLGAVVYGINFLRRFLRKCSLGRILSSVALFLFYAILKKRPYDLDTYQHDFGCGDRRGVSWCSDGSTASEQRVYQISKNHCRPYFVCDFGLWNCWAF